MARKTVLPFKMLTTRNFFSSPVPRRGRRKLTRRGRTKLTTRGLKK